MIAVCLLTCDRPELTALAVSSFHKYHQDRSDLRLLHCDGGSLTPENVDLARAYGYVTLVAPERSERIGQMETLRYFVQAAFGCDWVLWLENDWEAVAPIPTEDFLNASCADTVRMFGGKKMRSGPRQLAGTRRILTQERINWVPDGDIPGWEVGRAHWGAGGTIIRTDILRRQWHQPRLKDVIKAENNLFSMRPVENIMWCHGLVTTEGVIG